MTVIAAFRALDGRRCRVNVHKDRQWSAEVGPLGAPEWTAEGDLRTVLGKLCDHLEAQCDSNHPDRT